MSEKSNIKPIFIVDDDGIKLNMTYEELLESYLRLKNTFEKHGDNKKAKYYEKKYEELKQDLNK